MLFMAKVLNSFQIKSNAALKSFHLKVDFFFLRKPPGSPVIKNLPANAGDIKTHRFDPRAGKIP